MDNDNYELYKMLFQFSVGLLIVTLFLLRLKSKSKDKEGHPEAKLLPQVYALKIPFLRKKQDYVYISKEENPALPLLLSTLDRGDTLVFTFYNDEYNTLHLALNVLNKGVCIIGTVLNFKEESANLKEFTFTWSYIDEDGEPSELMATCYRLNLDYEMAVRMFLDNQSHNKTFCFDTYETYHHSNPLVLVN